MYYNNSEYLYLNAKPVALGGKYGLSAFISAKIEGLSTDVWGKCK
jgi:hypothetical protein